MKHFSPGFHLLAALAGCSLPCAAQTTPQPVRFYAGGNIFLQTSQPFSAYRATRLSPALTAGIQLTPRLALQVSGAYRVDNSTFHDVYIVNGSPVVEAAESRYRRFTVPVLLRATLTNPASRWQLDGLVGPTLLFAFYHQTYTQTYQGRTTRDGTSNELNTELSINLGPGVRYALTPRVQLVANALLDVYVPSNFFGYNGAFSSNLSTHLLAGVHYRFGQ